MTIGELLLNLDFCFNDQPEGKREIGKFDQTKENKQ